MEVISSAFLISQSTDYPLRYDQVSGDNVELYFEDGEMTLTDVRGSQYSIYYLYEDKYPNGVNKSSSQNAKIYFENKKVESVHLYGSPVSEYYPEHQVYGKEKTFTLPGFALAENRPVKQEILSTLRTKKSL